MSNWRSAASRFRDQADIYRKQALKSEQKEEGKRPTSASPEVRNGTVQDMAMDAPLDACTPMSYLYLTFDTPLPIPIPIPLPNTTVDSSPHEERLPPCPDLSRYTDPLTWPKARKNVMVFISCMATCCTAYTAGAYSQPADLIAAELGTTREGALAGVTTFCMGFALAPMVLAPFSEINGRYPIFAVAGVVFTVFQAVCGVVTNLPGMLIARFIKGVGGSVFSTMVGGVIADMYDKEERNTPMALFSGAVLIGTGLGPLVAAVMVQNWGEERQKWKWIFWHQVIVDFVLMVTVVALFKESRGSVLLSRKAKKLNQWYEELERHGFYGVWIRRERLTSGTRPQPTSATTQPHSDEEAREWEKSPSEGLRLRRMRWLVREDEQRGSISTMIRVSLLRPFHLLFTEPIVFFFSLWVSFAWAVLYLTFGSIPLIFRRQYDFNTVQAGLVFIAMIAGAILATVIGIYQESMLKHPGWQAKSAGSGNDSTKIIESSRLWAFVRRRFPAESPESRLYFTCLTSVLLPAGLYLFFFTAQPSIHWLVPTVAIGVSTMGIYYIYLATFNYLADTYQIYASSALAAQSFCRNVLGGIFPLVTGALIHNLGEDAAGGLLGGIATCLTVVPWVLVFFGESIRRRSSFAVSVQNDF
ncbi:Uu.00g024790.m01.CDS01 [Anthostomella pinea]|uniref:Uu.00g024790.m01.CDS01 n=1 Tax=Anthostomella pinea TaxID=933095 RepID=A0AAI8V777_9PEZI|nr:Uu.00g024790.m01.CDS01 [Anthostomella pinea]